MTSTLDIFGLDTDPAADGPGPTLALPGLGLAHNPFDPTHQHPLYTKHMEELLAEIRRWISSAASGQPYPLSMEGNNGIGKTRLIKHICDEINLRSSSRGLYAHAVYLSDGGFARPSIGRLLLDALRSIRVKSRSDVAPEGALPLVFAAVCGERTDVEQGSPLGRALAFAQKEGTEKRDRLAIAISKWLQREQLSASEQRESGLAGAIEWEGNLVREIAVLLRFAKAAGVLQAFYVCIDQLEDLWTKAFTPLRRSRLLTDLRVLMDEMASSTCVGLLLSWTPNIKAAGDFPLAHEYPALYSRLIGNIKEFPYLQQEDSVLFAREMLDGFKQRFPEEAHTVQRKVVPVIETIAAGAWEKIAHGEETPRRFLQELSKELAAFSEGTAGKKR